MEHLPKLQEIELAVTSRCNLRCRHCSAATSRRCLVPEPSLSAIQQVLTDARSLGATDLDLTGGEPTQRCDFVDIVTEATRIGFRTKLITNGVRLTRSALERLRSAGLAAMAVSIDGSSSAVHARTRRTTAEEFQRTVQAVRMGHDVGLRVKVNTVVSRANLDDLPVLALFVDALGCYEHRFCVLQPVGRGRSWSNQLLSEEAWLTYVQDRLACLDVGMPLVVSLSVVPSSYAASHDVRCFGERSAGLYVAVDGRCSPCPMLAFVKRDVGNCTRESLRTIWDDDQRWNRLKSIAGCVCPRVNEGSGANVGVCPRRRIIVSELRR